MSLNSRGLRVAGILVLLGTATAVLSAQQERPYSPVFKNRVVPPPPLLRQSDALQEIWQAFLVSRKAHGGDPVAQHELGVRSMLGRGVEADTVQAAYWFEQASARNMLSSRFNLGILRYHGWGESWNPFTSYEAFLSCAESGMADAQFAVALFYLDNLVVPRDYRRALSWARRAAENGFEPAKEAVPQLEKSIARDTAKIEPGDGTPSEAIPFLSEDAGDTATQRVGDAFVKSVALGGDPELRKSLGLARMLDADLSVDSLRRRGITAAAATGSPEALAVLGRYREKGADGTRDVVQACGYYVRAVRMDWPRAARLLWNLVHQNGVVSEIRTRARKGDNDAQYVWVALLALGYESVLMQEQALLTPEQAVRLLRKGAEQDHLPSLVELGLCAYAGRWMPQNTGEAVRLWKRASALGSREADIRLAVLQVQNPQDSLTLKQAVSTLGQAAEDGSILAEVALGYCYEHGVGVPPRLAESVRLYRIAARRGSQDAYRSLQRLHDAIRPTNPTYRVEDNG